MASKSINKSKTNRPIELQRFLLNHRFKKIGIGIAVVSFIALFVNAFGIESGELKFLSKNGMLLGTLLISVSKEEFEDELISNLRMQSFAVAFISGVILSIFQPYLSYLVDMFFTSSPAVFKDTGDFQILWILLTVKVFYFESLKRFYS